MFYLSTFWTLDCYCASATNLDFAPRKASQKNLVAIHWWVKTCGKATKNASSRLKKKLFCFPMNEPIPLGFEIFSPCRKSLKSHEKDQRRLRVRNCSVTFKPTSHATILRRSQKLRCFSNFGPEMQYCHLLGKIKNLWF